MQDEQTNTGSGTPLGMGLGGSVLCPTVEVKEEGLRSTALHPKDERAYWQATGNDRIDRTGARTSLASFSFVLS